MPARDPPPCGGSALSAPRFCPTCGRPVPLENSFCAWCGTPMTPLAAPPPAGAPPVAAPAPPAAPMPPPGAPPYGYPPPTYVMPKKADTSSLLSGTFDVWVKDFGSYFLVFVILALVTGGLSLAGSYLILHVPFVSGGAFAFTNPSTSDVVAYVAYELVVAMATWIFTSMILGGVVDFAIRRYRGETARMMDGTRFRQLAAHWRYARKSPGQRPQKNTARATSPRS